MYLWMTSLNPILLVLLSTAPCVLMLDTTETNGTFRESEPSGRLPASGGDSSVYYFKEPAVTGSRMFETSLYALLILTWCCYELTGAAGHELG